MLHLGAFFPSNYFAFMYVPVYSLEDHLVHQKSLFLDMVYLQQDPFDQVGPLELCQKVRTWKI